MTRTLTMRLIGALLALLAFCAPAYAQGEARAIVVASCNTAITTYTTGTTRPLTVDASGKLCTNLGPFRCTLANLSTSVVTGGSAVTIAGQAGINYIFIQNPSSAAQQNIAAAETLFIDPSATAVVNGPNSIEILPGNSWVMESSVVSVGAISVNATTSGHRFVMKGC